MCMLCVRMEGEQQPQGMLIRAGTGLWFVWAHEHLLLRYWKNLSVPLKLIKGSESFLKWQFGIFWGGFLLHSAIRIKKTLTRLYLQSKTELPFKENGLCSFGAELISGPEKYNQKPEMKKRAKFVPWQCSDHSFYNVSLKWKDYYRSRNAYKHYRPHL